MINKTDKYIGSLLSLIGYNPQVFSELKNTNKNINIHEKHPFNSLYGNYVYLRKSLNDSEREDVRNYLNSETNPLIPNLSNENYNTDNLTKLVGMINLIVDHVPTLKHDYFEQLKQCNEKNTLQAFKIRKLPKDGSESYTCINQFVIEFNCLYESLKQNERREFFDKMSILWETIPLENFKDDMPFEEFKDILPFKDFKNDMSLKNFDDNIEDHLKFDSTTQQVKIQFSEYLSGCEKIVTLRRGKRRRLFRIQIDAFDENLNKEVDGYQFKIIVDQNDRWDIEKNRKDLILYFTSDEKNSKIITSPMGKNIVTNGIEEGDTLKDNNYGKEGMTCTIKFIPIDKQPEIFNVNNQEEFKK